MIQFTLFLGGRAERTVVVKTLPVVIGRTDSSTLQIDNPMVSREHAVVDYVDGRFTLRDLGSGNGTYKDDLLVTEDILEDGDEFLIGKHLIRFTITDPSLRAGGITENSGGVQKYEQTMALESAELRKIIEKSSANRQICLEISKRRDREHDEPRRIRIVRPFLVIGKGTSCDVIVSGWNVPHAQILIAAEGNHFLAIDLEGKGIARHNGRPFTRIQLADQDVIEFRGNRIRFVEEVVREETEEAARKISKKFAAVKRMG